MTFERAFGADRGPRRRRGLLPRALVRLPPVGRDRRRRDERVRRALRVDRRARQRDGQRSSTPRSPRATACACCATSPRSRRSPSHDPLPGDRHHGRPGGAPGRGRLRGRDDLPRRPARGRPLLGRRRARASCTSSTSTAPAPARRSRSSTCAGSSRETGIPVQYGGGLRTVDAVRDALRAGAERAVVGTAAFRDIDFLDDIVAAFGAADRRRRRRQGRHDRHRGLDADDARCRSSTRSSA